MENCHKFFSNKSCKYFPCHKGMEGQEFNCMFCYCPMNSLEKCLGNPKFVKSKDGKMIKDCTDCTYPHVPEHYDAIIEFLKKNPPSVRKE